MADSNDFMVDEDLFEFDDFFTKKARQKIKTKLSKVVNTAKQKLPPHLKDTLLKPIKQRSKSSCEKQLRGMRFSSAQGREDWLRKCLGNKAESQAGTRIADMIASDPRTCEQIVAENMRKASKMKGLFGRRYRMASKSQQIAMCMAKKQRQAIQGKPNLSNLTKVGISPSLVSKLKDIEVKDAKGMKLKDSEIALVEDVNETLAPTTDVMDVEMATADVSGSTSKKPPYILYGAIGLIVLFVGFKMIKG